ncbi:hypothetical protein E2C01_074159 [Portunus trituberculatus]|uniref:Uncharacterized protein n=1 Tax=Portunus trituberculatus TaxID=210409 RepID=A0A5B7IBF8_PORTR|nr:hypothetical protein [Portunus trituberculatus]
MTELDTPRRPLPPPRRPLTIVCTTGSTKAWRATR